MGKDVAIREVHHRVKNNLQTISSLLRLQSRRLPKGEARHALEEAERRVRSIAVVHEILSRDTADEVDFNDILPSLVRMAEDFSGAFAPVRVSLVRGGGEMGAQVATPLAVALNELVQNAVEHAFAPPPRQMGELSFEMATPQPTGPTASVPTSVTGSGGAGLHGAATAGGAYLLQHGAVTNCSYRSGTTASACRQVFRSRPPPASACRSCAALLTVS